MFTSQPEEQALLGSFESFKSEADFLYRTGEYKKAVPSYTAALKFRPDSRICLVRRSECYLMYGDTTKSLKDAEASLVEDKNYHRGVFRKAEALYNQGDFEMALVFYHRGNRLRPELENFRLGIRKAQEAIYNCVGTPDRIKLTTTGDLSFFYPLVESKQKRKGALCAKTQKQVQRRQPLEKAHNERTINQMLGDLYGDRVFLENLLKRIETETITGQRVKALAIRSLNYLDTRKELWQQVKPVYARKYEAQKALLSTRTPKISTHDHVQHELEKIDVMMAAGNHDGALKRGQKLMSLLEKYTVIQLTNKTNFTAVVHSAIGNAFLELNDFENALEHHQSDLAIAEDYGIDEAECRALDNIGRVYARMGNYQHAIEIWERKLPLSKGAVETTWLCHEIGRCYLILGNAELAKAYGEKSLDAAMEATDDRWQLHALVLISQAEVKSNRLSSSLINFEKALEIASLLNDVEAEATIQTAIKGVNQQITDRKLQLEEPPLNLPETNDDKA